MAPRRAAPSGPEKKSKPRAPRVRAAKAAPAPQGRPTLQAAVAGLQKVTADLARQGEALAHSIAETPRPEQFQPLADHLYEFARLAPQVAAHFEAFPRVTAPLADNVAALRDVAETLEALHGGFSDSLLRLPRAEDYEPLAEPLRRFAATSPALLAALADVLRVVSPLGSSVAALQALAEDLQGSHLRELATVAPALAEAMARAPRLLTALETVLPTLQARAAEPAPPSQPPAAPEAVALVTEARTAVLEALAAIPREPDYAPIAAQLRELATVSPSFMEWLNEVPRVSTPLAGSVAGLRRASDLLKEALDRLGGEGAGGADAPPLPARFDSTRIRP